jgi:hypothetical protein
MSHGTWWSIVIAAWLLCSSSAFAVGFRGGNTLLQDCTYQNISFCYGYVDAVTEALGQNTINGYEACVPGNVVAGQMYDIVVQYLRKNPADRHLLAVGSVADAIPKAFPCRRQ